MRGNAPKIPLASTVEENIASKPSCLKGLHNVLKGHSGWSLPCRCKIARQIFFASESAAHRGTPQGARKGTHGYHILVECVRSELERLSFRAHFNLDLRELRTDTWIIEAAVRQRTDASEMWCWRRMLRIPLKRQLKITRRLLTTRLQRILEYFSHFARKHGDIG
ncbi:jg27996 [Pararge aegeria aegeria]|uniref:Jg27996 protein n=1 Tax=Pararge aegeria aegeria TaxID=348720 RepID=A0A8S4QQP8_9NEOP|nr:jg27996 [Pararge aegeria aegeria]